MLGLGAGTDDISGSSGAGEANARHLGMDRQGVAHNRTLSDNQETKGTSASSKHCINALAIAAVEVAGFQTMGQPAARPGAR